MSTLQNDIYLCSYPRSGNTWTRLLLSDIFMQQNGIETNSKIVLERSDKIIPDVHCHDIDDVDKNINLPFRIIKTHKENLSEYNKIIFLFRDPGDALVSYFHFRFGSGNLNSKYDNNINSFVIDEIDNWVHYSTTYLTSKYNDSILYISYEQLHIEPILTLARINKFLNYTVSDKIIKKAVSNNDFKNYKGTWQMKKEGNLGGAFFRKGQVGSKNKELEESTIEMINEKASIIYRKLQDKEAWQQQSFLKSHSE